jgi:vancomycin resistance protein YoaR
MKKSLSVISSLLFAALCLGFAFNAYAQDVTALNDANTVISISEQNYVYDGTPKKPTVSVYYNGILLSENVDYSLKYDDFVVAGTAKVTVTGINSYTGSVTKEYTIKPITFNSKNLSVTFDKTSLVYYDSAVHPVMYVSFNGQPLVQDVDYKVTYSKNNAPGRATVKITGIGNFAGSVSKTFIISPQKVNSVSIAKNSATTATVSWGKVDKVSGYEILKYDANKNSFVHAVYASADSTSYQFTKLQNSALHSYVVKAYKTIDGDKYFGEQSDAVSVFIKPAKAQLTSVTMKNSTLNVEWKKLDCTGYEIIYTTDSKFKKGLKTVKIKNSNKTKKAIKKLKKGKKYYVKVRAYAVNNGKKLYGSKSTMLSSYFSNVYSTYYSYYVNNKDRTTNLKIASKKINGTIIQPGETFDFNKIVGSRTSSKGYKKAHVFTGGDGVAMGLAGGICQVASTTFNAALLANVQIVERHQHSQRVSYVPLGRDAAISGNVQNFKWKNNTKYAIKVGMTVKGGKITCTFYTCQKAKPKKVNLNVTQKGKNFTLKRRVKGKVNYTCRSKY